MRVTPADFQELADFEKMPEGPKISVEGERHHCNIPLITLEFENDFLSCFLFAAVLRSQYVRLVDSERVACRRAAARRVRVVAAVLPLRRGRAGARPRARGLRALLPRLLHVAGSLHDARGPVRASVRAAPGRRPAPLLLRR